MMGLLSEELSDEELSKLREEIFEYCNKEIYKNEKMGTTIIFYKSDIYNFFNSYSKDDIDLCLEVFVRSFDLMNYKHYELHGVKKVKIKNKKGWF